MKKFLLSLAFTLLLSPLSAAGERFFSITNFNGGLNSRYSSLSIADNEVQDSLNVVFDEDNAGVKRNGYTTYGSTTALAFTNGWVFTDSGNNNWIIVLTSNSIIASSGDGSFTTRIATVPTPTQSLIGAANAEGRIYFVDQVQGVYYWTGTGGVTYVAGSPKGSIITEFKGRLWVSGEANPNQNRLTTSKFLDGTTWTTGTLATDPIAYIVGLNDKADGITGMFSGLNDAIYLFKNKSVYALYGFDQTDFQIRVLTSESGCIDAGSIQPYAGGIVYVSLRGIEIFDGVFPRIISKKIQNKIASILLTGFNQRSYTQTAQGDWALNTISPTSSLSTSITPGSVVLSTAVAASQSDNTAANFNSGTKTNTSVSIEHTGSLSLSIASSQDSRETSLPSYNSSGYSCTSLTQDIAPKNNYMLTGIYLQLYKSGTPPTSYQVDFLDGGVVVTSASIGTAGLPSALSSPTGPGFDPISLSADFYYHVTAGHTYTIRLSPTAGSGTCDASNHVNWAFGLYNSVGAYGFNLRSSSYTASGTFVSRTYDVGFTTATWMWDWGTLSDESSIPTNTTLSYETQSSADGVSFDSLVPVAAEAITTSTVRRYIRYKASLATTDKSYSANIGSVTLNTGPFRKPIGSMTSPIQDLGTSITTFGSFDVDQDITTGGTISFSVCTSSMATLIPSACTAQSANSQILAAVNRYATIVTSESITGATQNPRLDRYVLKWNDGNRRPRMASAVYKDRYLLSCATNAASGYNDATVVLSRNIVGDDFIWTMFDIHAGAYLTYKGELYHAAADPVGKVYLDNQGYNDDGVAINAYFITKDYAIEGIVQDKIYQKFWVLSDALGNYNLRTSYFLDRVLTNEFQLSAVNLDETAGMINVKLPFPYSGAYQKMGRTISFKFSNTTVNAPMHVYGGSLYYLLRPPE